MARAAAKGNTESAAEMEARIRAEVEEKIRAEAEMQLRSKIEAEVRMKMAPGSPQSRAKMQAELEAFLKTLPHKPRYRLTEKAYLGDVMYDPESKPWQKDVDPPQREPLIVDFLGRPGPHMVPVNEAAEAMMKKYPPMNVDPIGELSIVGPEGTQALKQATQIG